MDGVNRNTGLLLFGAGLYLTVGHIATFLSANALALAALGFALIRGSRSEERKDLSGYVLLVAAAVVLLVNHWGLMIALVIVTVGWFLFHSKKRLPHEHGDQVPPLFVKQHIVASLRWGRDETWTVRPTELTVAIAEVQMDMTNAIFEQPDTVIHLQGIIGDIDIVVPEEIGLAVNAQVAVGEIQVAGERGSGLMNRIVWRSPNFEAAEQRVQLYISYAVADVDVKVL